MGWKGVVRMDKGENAQYLQKAKNQASFWFLHTPRWAESHLKFSVLARVATLQNSNSTKQTKLKWKKKKKGLSATAKSLNWRKKAFNPDPCTMT